MSSQEDRDEEMEAEEDNDVDDEESLPEDSVSIILVFPTSLIDSGITFFTCGKYRVS
jgi:hypothetical protein